MKNNKAFTLAEILIVFIIIGIIATLGISTVKPWEKALRHSYSRIYNALGLAIYNYVVSNEDGVHSFPADRDDGAGGTVSGAETFCRGLAYFMNNIENNCSESFLDNSPNFSNFKAESSGGKKPHLILSNGVKLWIGADGTDAFSTDITLAGGVNPVVDTVRYYLVYADLTGDKKPNSPIWRPSKPADVVAFAVTNQFVVVPLGYPIVDRRYLTAHVMVPSSGEDDGGDSETPTDPMTFYEAATYAYGRHLMSKGDALSYQIELNKAIFPSSPSNDFKHSFIVSDCVRYSGGSSDCVATNTTVFSAKDRTRFFQSQPQFNQTFCGINSCGGLNGDGSATQYCEPICSVKIYDYH